MTGWAAGKVEVAVAGALAAVAPLVWLGLELHAAKTPPQAASNPVRSI